MTIVVAVEREARELPLLHYRCARYDLLWGYINARLISRVVVLPFDKVKLIVPGKLHCETLICARSISRHQCDTNEISIARTVLFDKYKEDVVKDSQYYLYTVHFKYRLNNVRNNKIEFIESIKLHK